MSRLQGPSYVPDNTNINSLVILLHGYGADGQDLIDLAPFFASFLPNTAFHSPDGPEICEVSPFGRQWFSLARTDPEFLRRQAATQAVAFEAMYDGACEAAPLVEEYIEELMGHYQLSAAQVCLVGFSQGTMMALHVGLRRSEPFAGLVGFSGALVGSSKLVNEKKSSPPILLVHGEDDDMLPVHAVDLAKKGLENVDLNTTILKRPGLPHSIDQEGAEAAAQFLKRYLTAPS